MRPRFAVRVVQRRRSRRDVVAGGCCLGDTAVLEGPTGDTQWDEASGDFIQIADFSAWSQAGTYVLAVGDEKSAPFTIGDDIYGPLAVDAMRYFYLNRSGIELTSRLRGRMGAPCRSPLRCAGHLLQGCGRGGHRLARLRLRDRRQRRLVRCRGLRQIRGQRRHLALDAAGSVRALPRGLPGWIAEHPRKRQRRAGYAGRGPLGNGMDLEDADPGRAIR